MLYNIKKAIAYVAEKQYLCTEIINHLIIVIMKEKLTKNDSMCTIYCDTAKLIERFEQILRSYNVYHIYYATFYELFIDELSGNLYNDWCKWADNVNPKYWISHIKDCDPNPNRLIDWHKINDEWRKCLADNLHSITK